MGGCDENAHGPVVPRVLGALACVPGAGTVPGRARWTRGRREADLICVGGSVVGALLWSTRNCLPRDQEPKHRTLRALLPCACACAPACPRARKLPPHTTHTPMHSAHHRPHVAHTACANHTQTAQRAGTSTRLPRDSACIHAPRAEKLSQLNAYCALHTAHCTLRTAHCALHTMHCSHNDCSFSHMSLVTHPVCLLHGLALIPPPTRAHPRPPAPTRAHRKKKNHCRPHEQERAGHHDGFVRSRHAT
jgi:hypothetical protein